MDDALNKIGFGSQTSNISEMIGKIIVEINGCERDSTEIVFTGSDGTKYILTHIQDCCEYVRVEDVCGDIRDLIGRPITISEEVTDDLISGDEPKNCESFSWTFYKFATDRGYVTVRWLGESNGCYSERAQFFIVKPKLGNENGNQN